jgi:hypothetical protein
MTPQDRLTTLGLLWAAWERRGRALCRAVATTDPAWRLDGADAVRPRGRMPFGFSHLVGQVREVAPTHASAAGLLGDGTV